MQMIDTCKTTMEDVHKALHIIKMEIYCKNPAKSNKNRETIPKLHPHSSEHALILPIRTLHYVFIKSDEKNDCSKVSGTSQPTVAFPTQLELQKKSKTLSNPTVSLLPFNPLTLFVANLVKDKDKTPKEKSSK